MTWPFLTIELKSAYELLDDAGDLRADLHGRDRLQRAGRADVSTMSPRVICRSCTSGSLAGLVHVEDAPAPAPTTASRMTMGCSLFMMCLVGSGPRSRFDEPSASQWFAARAAGAARRRAPPPRARSGPPPSRALPRVPTAGRFRS